MYTTHPPGAKWYALLENNLGIVKNVDSDFWNTKLIILPTYHTIQHVTFTAYIEAVCIALWGVMDVVFIADPEGCTLQTPQD